MDAYEDNENWQDLEEELPLGIFPEAHPESCYHALQCQGLSCSRLNAELFYEMGQLARNRLDGCSTEELRELDLWDRLSGLSLWDEPVWKVDDPLATMLVFNKQFQLNELEQAAVEWGWLLEPGETLYSIINAYTQAAMQSGLSANASYRLQTVGGQILAMVK